MNYILSFSGTQFIRMMKSASFLFRDKRCVSGGLRILHLLDLTSHVFTKSGRETLDHFVPSTDLFFFPQPQEGCDNFFRLKERFGDA